MQFSIIQILIFVSIYTSIYGSQSNNYHHIVDIRPSLGAMFCPDCGGRHEVASARRRSQNIHRQRARGHHRPSRTFPYRPSSGRSHRFMPGIHAAQGECRGSCERHHLSHSAHQYAARGGGHHIAQRTHGYCRDGAQGRRLRCLSSFGCVVRFFQSVRPQCASCVAQGTRETKADIGKILGSRPFLHIIYILHALQYVVSEFYLLTLGTFWRVSAFILRTHHPSTE